MNEIKRMQFLAGLNEIKVNKPYPIPKGNDELLDFLIKYPELKNKIIDDWFIQNRFNNAGEGWDNVKQGWQKWKPEIFEDGSIYINDGDDNVLYIGMDPIPNEDQPKMLETIINISGVNFYTLYW